MMIRRMICTSMAIMALCVTYAVAPAQTSYQVELAPLAQQYGVGYVNRWTWKYTRVWSLRDGQVEARIGGVDLRSQWRTWAIFDVSGLSSTLEVQAVTLRIVPNYLQEPQWIKYHRLTLDPRIVEAEVCWNTAFGYVYAESGVQPGGWTVVLGDSANADIKDAVRGSGLFMVGITAEEGLDFGYVWMAGWGQQLPSLTVTYQDSNTPVEPLTWGQIKARYR